MKQVIISVVLCSTSLLASSGVAEEVKDEEKAAKAKVTKVSGVFESRQATELSAATEQIKSLVISRIVPHGTIVKKGQTVIWFEKDEPDKQLEDAENKMRLSEISMRESEFALEQFHETQKLDKAKAQRAYNIAKQDYDNFVRTDRERQVLSAEFSLKSSEASLANAVEELTQLEKMYKEDELTEESEEIVLKRAKQAVENAQFRLDGTEITTKRSLAQAIPRTQAEHEDALARQQLTYDKAIRALEFDRQRRVIAFEKEKKQLAKDKADLKELREDRKQLTIQAPTDGVIYHGAITRGRISDKPSSMNSGSSVTNEQVIATLVRPKPLVVRLELQEKDLGGIRVGTKGIVVPTAFPDRKLAGTVTTLSFIPTANNKFDGAMTVKLDNAEPAISPGMTCSVEFVSESAE